MREGKSADSAPRRAGVARQRSLFMQCFALCRWKCGARSADAPCVGLFCGALEARRQVFRHRPHVGGVRGVVQRLCHILPRKQVWCAVVPQRPVLPVYVPVAGGSAGAGQTSARRPPRVPRHQLSPQYPPAKVPEAQPW